MNDVGNRRHFYTLVEILTVCAIIAVLLGLSVAGFSVANRIMGDAKCKAMIKKVEIALENYKAKTGYYIQQSVVAGFYVDSYNTTSIDFNDFIDIPSKELTAAGIGRGALVDPFGSQFLYQCPGSHNRTKFDLYSYGPDATNDGGGDDDITNWK